MTHGTSAGEWQRREGNNTRGSNTGTAAACPRWKAEGFKKKYLWLFTWAVTAIAQWAEKRKCPPERDEKPFRVTLPSGWVFGLLWLASSYFMLKKALDITSLRGNAAGPDGLTFYETFQSPDWNESQIRELKQQIRKGRYWPGGVRAVPIRMGEKVRILHVPNLIDRVVERAIVLTVNPILEFAFHRWSFGFRSGVSTAHALAELFRLCTSSKRFVVGKMDMLDAFDRIPHERLMDVVS